MDVYDRYTSPTKAKRSDENLSTHLEVSEDEILEDDNKSGRCIYISALVLVLTFILALVHATMVESVLGPNKVDLSDAIENFDHLANLERTHLSLIKDIKEHIDERFANDKSEADEDNEDLVKYLEELRLKIDKLKDHHNDKESELSLVPATQIIPPASTFKQDPHIFTEKRLEKLKYDYLSEHKAWPYVGDAQYLSQFPQDSRPWLNSLAVFPYADATRQHGIVGLNVNGTRWWQPSETPPVYGKDSEDEKNALKKGGGFNLALSDSFPMDRDAADLRAPVCLKESYSLDGLPDASVIITFFNEPLSTLLRSVHSVLNTSPPPLLREIILVDDHSTLEENEPGGPLYEAVKNLPKVKILRLPHRHGLVQARLAGVKDAQGEVVLILDSHIECNPKWLEPLLTRLKESPRSLVFPQIPSMDSVDFSYQKSRGIGCKLTFKWLMQEQSTAVADFPTTDPIPSASMAGGLFAVYRDFFWHMGGYDEGMTMWGAENVEMPFRYWMCGARVECVPCSRVYHIYRKGGTGYKSPSNTVVVNRLRTAYLWTDEFFPLAHMVINNGKAVDIGNIDKMLAFKEKMRCKDFRWFMEFLEVDKDPKHLDDVELLGQLQSLSGFNSCLDSLGNKNFGDPFGMYGCHGTGGTQAWMSLGDKKLRPSTNENLCANSTTLRFDGCKHQKAEVGWSFDRNTKTVRNYSGTKCLTYDIAKGSSALFMSDCIEEKAITEANKIQKWEFHPFDGSSSYVPPRHSDQWLLEHQN